MKSAVCKDTPRLRTDLDECGDELATPALTGGEGDPDKAHKLKQQKIRSAVCKHAFRIPGAL
jgi:hypothetical protein